MYTREPVSTSDYSVRSARHGAREGHDIVVYGRALLVTTVLLMLLQST